MEGQNDVVKLPARPHHFNPLNTELIPIYHLLALLGAHHIFHVSRLRVNMLKHYFKIVINKCSH